MYYTTKTYYLDIPPWVSHCKYYDYESAEKDSLGSSITPGIDYAISDSLSTDQALSWNDERMEPTKKQPYLFQRHRIPTFHINGAMYSIKLIKTHESMVITDEIDGIESEISCKQDSIKALKERVKDLKTKLKAFK